MIYFLLFIYIVSLLKTIEMSSPSASIVGHRGCGSSTAGGISRYPENSLFSFKKALDENVDGVELDVWLTKDNQVIVLHGTEDGLLGHTLLCNKDCENKNIEELNLDEIQKYHFKEPWILNHGKTFNEDNYELNNNQKTYSSLTEQEKLEKENEYGNFDKAYINLEEHEDIEKLINEKFLNNFYNLNNKNNYEEPINDTEYIEKEKKIFEEYNLDTNINTEEDYINSIKCSHCKDIYKKYMMPKTHYHLKKKQLLFKFISMFYHVPLLENLLNLYKNKLTYDIELKGNKEDLGLYILNILQNYKDYKFKFSSFNWLLQYNDIQEKIHKQENINSFNYEAYPFYNVDRIDLLKVLRNNKLNIPVALLFSDDEIMPDINTILYTMKYYNAQWAHFSFRLKKNSIVVHSNPSNITIPIEDFIKIFHNNNKKIMIYWGTEDNDKADDIFSYIKLDADSLCPNDIVLAKYVLQGIKENDTI
ncbi:glycerophosphodiester phosphodiesterase, putative [Plasmodium reichenowi]|uniref:Glycerophosphodiester phosphodiesterase, putative n=1 Tax=Plasmodium reichenowi TaxID=5854 RepID=A0A151L441_PLARE|nr:glycerophosphodiester phosphodiesterase, putative [Plasmodium reichenowi]KYN93721.1 glycerophosphodiester phosphodiesterase, putative [Plasmodium reichenowi]